LKKKKIKVLTQIVLILIELINYNFMEKLIDSLKNWLKDNVHMESPLKEGASDKEFAALEDKLQVQLPEDFKQFYKFHNGQSEDAPYITPLGEMLSLEGIAFQWELWKGLVDDNVFEDNNSEPDEGIKDDWYNPKWIPFTYDGSGNHLCIDLDPAEGGKVGQVITMWHDGSERELIAGSFNEWLALFVQQLNDGYFRYDHEMGNLERLKW